MARKAKLFWQVLMQHVQTGKPDEVVAHGFVGTVEVPNELTGHEALEFVWEKANTIDCAWWENAESELASGMTGARSMMVGDLVVLDDEVWQVADTGFEPADVDLSDLVGAA